MIDAPNCTQIPNDILDNLVGRSEDQVKIMLLICYETFKWRSEPEAASDGMVNFNYIFDKLIIDEKHINKACNVLEKDGLIRRTVVGQSTYFSLVMESE
jgi:hypothetical protein